MSNSDVRVPKPTEGRERNRINMMAWGAGILFVAVAFATYFLLGAQARTNGTTNGTTTATIARYPGVVVYEQRTPGADGRAQRIVVKQRADGVPFVDLLEADSADLYADKAIEITDGPVVDVVGDRIFTVGPSREESILVRIDHATDCLQHFRPGQRVKIDGAIKNMPARDVSSSWGLKDDERGLAGKRGVYLEATTVIILEADAENRPGC